MRIKIDSAARRRALNKANPALPAARPGGAGRRDTAAYRNAAMTRPVAAGCGWSIRGFISFFYHEDYEEFF